MDTLNKTLVLAALGWLFSLSACGSIDSPSSKGEPLWSFKGRITEVQKGLEVRALRAAVLWGAEGDTRFVAQDIPVKLTGQLPTIFRLDVFEPPPERAFGN
ncbi:MAG: hypothetical protein MUC50_23675 [Myxococcota bacterium]|nr:hypothetical protein [Myxococcota bacterium]